MPEFEDFSPTHPNLVTTNVVQKPYWGVIAINRATANAVLNLRKI